MSKPTSLMTIFMLALCLLAFSARGQREVLSACRLLPVCRSWEHRCSRNLCHGIRDTSCCRNCGSCTCRIGGCWASRFERREGRCGGWPARNRCCVQC